jgi:hypothetical protein
MGTASDATGNNPPTGDTFITAMDFVENGGDPYVVYGGYTEDSNIE